MTFRAATAVINCQALTDNFKVIKKRAPASKILAVLKANGYGHGLERIANALPAADAFGVARIDEALALRAAGITQAIVLLEGFFSPEDLPIVVVNDLSIVVHNQEQLQAIEKASLIRPVNVWLKIDTGMHRLGIDPSDFSHFYHRLMHNANVQHPLIIMSHLSCADDIKDNTTEQQLATFNKIAAPLSEQKSLANSAAIVAWPQTHFDWVRPGLMLYGVSPMLNEGAKDLNVSPVMTLQASIIALRKITAGETVGYGSAWLCQQNTTIGIIAIGYGDGYPRHAPNGTPVLVNGRRVPLVGRVSMDMITVDLGENAQDKVGDCAILWGDGLPVEDVAKWASTIPYELLCNITRRVKIEVV